MRLSSINKFNPEMILCLDDVADKPVAWYDINKKLRQDNEASQCDRCWRWTPYAPVCKRCAEALLLLRR